MKTRVAEGVPEKLTLGPQLGAAAAAAAWLAFKHIDLSETSINR